MPGTWYPSLQEQLASERIIARREDLAPDDDAEFDEVYDDALEHSNSPFVGPREHLLPVDCEDLPWPDWPPPEELNLDR